MLFNLVVDTVICAWEKQIEPPPSPLEDVDCAFYANDGKLGGRNASWIQLSLDILTHLFACVGLHMNAKKTQAMETKGHVTTIQ